MTTTHKTSRNKETVTKQEAVVYYNSGKQGIDISDQLASYQGCTRNSDIRNSDTRYSDNTLVS
jgi:hypothetical protein